MSDNLASAVSSETAADSEPVAQSEGETETAGAGTRVRHGRFEQSRSNQRDITMAGIPPIRDVLLLFATEKAAVKFLIDNGIFDVSTPCVLCNSHMGAC